MTAAAEQPAPGQRPPIGHTSPPAPARPSYGSLPDDTLRGAASVAIEALEERARASRLLLTDRTLYGLTDPQVVERSLARDAEAAQVLRAAYTLWSLDGEERQ